MCLAACHLYKWYCRGTGIHYGNFREGRCINTYHECLLQCFILAFCSPSKHFSVLAITLRNYTSVGKLLSTFFFNDLCFIGAWTPWVLSKWYSGQVSSNSAKMKQQPARHGNHRVSHFVPTHMALYFKHNLKPDCSVECVFLSLHGFHLFTLISFGKEHDNPFILVLTDLFWTRMKVGRRDGMSPDQVGSCK